MIQSNENFKTTERLCENDIIRSLASDSLSKKLFGEENTYHFFKDIASDRSPDNPFLFLHKMLKNEVYEGSALWDTDVSNETIEHYCQGTRARESDIQHAKLKVLLILKHLRFIDNAMTAYRSIVEECNRLPKKNRITQKDVEDELLTTSLLFKISRDISTQKNDDIDATISSLNRRNDSRFPYLENAKDLGIPFKELRRTYPKYRTFSNSHARLLHCFSIYSYCFFLNHFTYSTREEAAQFAYSTKNFISRKVLDEKPSSYVKSSYTSLLDEINRILSEKGPNSVQYDSIVSCNYLVDEEILKIGLYFPITHHNYIENLSR